MWVASFQRSNRPPDCQGFPSQRAATRFLLTVANECDGRICVWELDDTVPTWPARKAA